VSEGFLAIRVPAKSALVLCPARETQERS